MARVDDKELLAERAERVMFDALLKDDVKTMNELIKKGFQMDTFLTISRLECLYNTTIGPPNMLHYIVRDVTRINPHYQYNLPDIGLVLEKLMGGAFESYYTSKEFKKKWTCSKIEQPSSKSRRSKKAKSFTPPLRRQPVDFKHPFSDLFVWAVLKKRQEMAMSLWRHGEEALTKALVAVRLNKSLALEASEDYLDQEFCENYQHYSQEFQRLSVQLLEECFQTNALSTLSLLTYELDNWGKHTNLSLAVIAQHGEFLAHSLCQFLLSDLWTGGLNIRRFASVKILLALLFPGFILKLNYKSSKELMMQPQKTEEIEKEKTDYDKFHSDIANTPRRAVTDDDESSTKDRSWVRNKDKAKTVAQTIASTDELPLSPMKRFYEFFVAPITTFWILTIAYCFFLILISFTALTEIHRVPCWEEIYMMAYVVTLAAENFRRIIISQGRNFRLKLIIYFQHYWNWVYAMAILCFFVAMLLRFLLEDLSYARIGYACDTVFWYILLLDLMTVHFQVGVYIIMMKKMIIGMLQVLSILAVVLVSFDVIRQSIHYPHDDWDWDIARNVVYKPYFMLYGEVYAEEIDTCNDEGKDCEVMGRWLTPIYMAIFMLISNVLVINLMIAVFNHIFAEINANSQEVWRFYRYSVVLDYEYKPFLPPPFIALFFVFFIIKQMKRKIERGNRFDFALKRILKIDEVAAVYRFERNCVIHAVKSKKFQKSYTLDEKIQYMQHKIDKLSKNVGILLEILKKTHPTEELSPQKY